MDPKEARAMIDALLAELEERRARLQSERRRAGILGPLGLGVAIGLGGLISCGTDAYAAPYDPGQVVDVYGVPMDALQTDGAAGADAAGQGETVGQDSQSQDAPSQDAKPPEQDVPGAVDMYGVQPDAGPAD